MLQAHGMVRVMLWQKLPTTDVWKAIDIYLAVAYAAAPPSAVRAKLDTLRSLSAPEDFFQSPVFERDNAAAPQKLSLRLGNRFYPHMKLTIERAPDKSGYLSRRHPRPPRLPATGFA
jgi:hypothetical protein